MCDSAGAKWTYQKDTHKLELAAKAPPVGAQRVEEEWGKVLVPPCLGRQRWMLYHVLDDEERDEGDDGENQSSNDLR